MSNGVHGRVGRMGARLLLLMLMLSTMGAGFAATAGAAPSPASRAVRSLSQQQPGSVVNVELILDASGSMDQDVGGGETRMQAAKRVMKDVITAIPVQDGINVGFRIYGHKGNNTESGKAESCQASDLTVPIKGVDKAKLNAQVDAAKATGWTPLATSLERGGKDFAKPAAKAVNAIVMVTDGLETCGGDPCAIASAIHQGDAKVTVHVVGFALSAEEQGTVACIAKNGGGLNLSAANASELSTALFTILQQLNVVVTTGFLEIESIGGLFPKAHIQGGGGATDANPKGKAVDVTLTDKNNVELAVGVYDGSWANPSGQLTKIRVNIEADRTTWIRGSILKFPQGAGEIYVVTDQAGVVIWQDQFQQGDYVWVLPGIYRMELLERVGDPILISAEVQTLPGTATQLEIFTAGS
ncbi:MAG: VWA domain-containing protein [Thermomicrobiales bacterium]